MWREEGKGVTYTVMEGDDMGGKHTMRYADDVLESYTCNI